MLSSGSSSICCKKRTVCRATREAGKTEVRSSYHGFIIDTDRYDLKNFKLWRIQGFEKQGYYTKILFPLVIVFKFAGLPNVCMSRNEGCIISDSIC